MVESKLNLPNRLVGDDSAKRGHSDGILSQRKAAALQLCSLSFCSLWIELIRSFSSRPSQSVQASSLADLSINKIRLSLSHILPLIAIRVIHCLKGRVLTLLMMALATLFRKTVIVEGCVFANWARANWLDCISEKMAVIQRQLGVWVTVMSLSQPYSVDLGNLSICAPLAISTSEPFIHRLIRSPDFSPSHFSHWSALFAFDTEARLKALFRALGILCMCLCHPSMDCYCNCQLHRPTSSRYTFSKKKKTFTRIGITSSRCISKK